MRLVRAVLLLALMHAFFQLLLTPQNLSRKHFRCIGTTVYSFGSKHSVLLNEDVSVAVFTQALQNIATLRAENGGSVSRLQFSKESAAAQRTNLEAANGRIMDVDIASEALVWLSTTY